MTPGRAAAQLGAAHTLGHGLSLLGITAPERM